MWFPPKVDPSALSCSVVLWTPRPEGPPPPAPWPLGQESPSAVTKDVHPTASAQPVTGSPPPAATAGALQKKPIDPVTPGARATCLSLSAVPLSPPWAQGGPQAFPRVDVPRVPMANRWEAGQPLPPPAWSPPLSWAWTRSSQRGPTTSGSANAGRVRPHAALSPAARGTPQSKGTAFTGAYLPAFQVLGSHL